MIQPTPRQEEILSFIRFKVDVDRVAPTIREIGQHFGIKSPNGVMCHIRALEAKGFLTWRRGLARTMRPVADADSPEGFLDALDDNSRECLIRAAKSRQVSVSDYVFAAAIAQAELDSREPNVSATIQVADTNRGSPTGVSGGDNLACREANTGDSAA